MLLYIHIYILYVSANALQFSVTRENIKGVFERLGFFFRIWMKLWYLSCYSCQISKAIETNLERTYYQLHILETSALESVFLKCLNKLCLVAIYLFLTVCWQRLKTLKWQ